MVSIQYNNERHNAKVGIVMVIIALFVICYMLASLVSNTHEFWLQGI